MELNDYQDRAAETAIYPGGGEITGLLYTALGVANEAGEVAGKVKKLLRDDGGYMTYERREQIAKELGDVLWYVAMVAKEIGWKLDGIAYANLSKLAERQSNDTLKGDGDNR